jgi:hypothetical protein
MPYVTALQSTMFVLTCGNVQFIEVSIQHVKVETHSAEYDNKYNNIGIIY